MATQSELAVGIDALAAIVGPENVLTGEGIPEELTHDEALTGVPTVPRAVVRPVTTEETAAVVTWASEQGVPVTARGSGTGLSGACIPQADGIVVSRSEEHTSELQSLMRIAYAVFFLKK